MDGVVVDGTTDAQLEVSDAASPLPVQFKLRGVTIGPPVMSAAQASATPRGAKAAAPYASGLDAHRLLGMARCTAAATLSAGARGLKSLDEQGGTRFELSSGRSPTAGDARPR